MIIGTNSWTWHQYSEASGSTLEADLDVTLAQVADAGLAAWEGGCGSPEQTDRLARLLDKHKLKMPSIYAGARLHEADWRASVDDVLRQADLARPLGTRVVVCNPDPINWGTKEDKTDEQLRRQAEALSAIATGLAERGMTLAYHTHDAELRAAARELHHMMLATADAGVRLCFDAHWLYRGSGNSNVAMLDLLALYGDRVAGVHLRQSRGGVWSQTLGPGDADLDAVARRLVALGFDGPVMLETCAEAGTPQTLSPVEAHRQSRAWAEAAFGVRPSAARA